MICCFLRVLKKNYPNTLSWGTLRIWTYVFQAESLRFFQYNKLLLSRERINILEKDISEKVNFKSVYQYNNFLFMNYLQKLNFILREITLSIKTVKSSVILPVDIIIQNYIQEFRKGIFLIYTDFVLSSQFLFLFSKKKFLPQSFLGYHNFTVLEPKNFDFVRDSDYYMFE